MGYIGYMDIKTVIAILRQKRLDAGISQRALAEKSGLHRTEINRIESGRHIPLYDNIKKIADALNVNLVLDIKTNDKNESWF